MAEQSGPVNAEPNTEAAADGPADGIALCLSGGGYRAMVFHIGALIRLNDAGLLPKLNRVSSVSGGSITAAALGLRWRDLTFDGKGVVQNLHVVVEALRKLASQTIDEKSVLGGIFSSDSIGERVAEAYAKHLFGGATLRDLPADGEGPRFVINATNVQTGALFRFSRRYLADYRLGVYPAPSVPLATVVAASSAFPPVLSPVDLRLDPQYWETTGADLAKPPFNAHMVLTDGGVYDNLGLETAWKNYKTVLVSDGGGKMAPDANPSRDWVGHSKRVLDLIDNQVRSLRYRHLIDSYKAPAADRNHRAGAYWGIRTDIAKYELGNALPCPHDRTMALAATPTRLEAMDAGLQDRLINWGFAVCDAALRAYYDKALPAPAAFPLPWAGV